MNIDAACLDTPVRGFRIVADEQGVVSGSLVGLRVADLSAGDVLVRVAYAGINYKDALASTTRGKVIRQFPRIGGVDLVGIVEASDHSDWQPGAHVLAHSCGIGVDLDGGFATHARIPGKFLQPVPEGLSLPQAGAIGMAGFSAALCLELLEGQGIRPDNGPVLINGATGAVAGLAIDMMSRLGFEVVALSSKAGAAQRLRAPGASQILHPSELADDGKPLGRARWQAAIDSVGGAQLDWLLRSAQPRACIVTLGNASGNALTTNVLPLILRGVRLIGANAMVYIDRQREIWQRMAGEIRPTRLIEQTRYIGLDELPAQLASMLAGSADGRVVLSPNPQASGSSHQG